MGNYLCEIGYKWETTFSLVQSLYEAKREANDKLRK